MSRKILVGLAGLLVVALVAVAVAGVAPGAWAVFSDTETSEGNTFDAGTLDLRVNGQDDPNVVSYDFGDNIEPGDTIYSPMYTLKNVGDVDGDVTVEIQNLHCYENGLAEPEITAGDAPGVQMDPDGFSQETGAGELWDQVIFSIVIDSGDGVAGVGSDCSHGLYPDESSHYSIPVGTPITLSGCGLPTLDPGEEVQVYLKVRFIDDLNTPYGWILDGVPNNAAMGDEVSMDLVFSLNQN